MGATGFRFELEHWEVGTRYSVYVIYETEYFKSWFLCYMLVATVTAVRNYLPFSIIIEANRISW